MTPDPAPSKNDEPITEAGGLPFELAEAIARLRSLTSRTDQWYDTALDVVVLELEARDSENSRGDTMTPGIEPVTEELTIEDWSWSQVPPPLLAVAPVRPGAQYVVIGFADPANGVGDNGDLEWVPRKLTPVQAIELSEALRSRAEAIQAAEVMR